MGANGTFSTGKDFPEIEQKYKTVHQLADNIFVLQIKSGANKLPEESHTAGRIYVSIEKDGSGIHEISKYGEDHKKVWSIHTADHHGLKPHFHYWRNGKQGKDAFPLTASMTELLNQIKYLRYGKK